MHENNSDKLSVKSMVEDIVGCKWSLSVLDMIDKGINRPGVMAKEINGLSAKVLNERLRKFLKYKILEKKEYKELPPRVEYKFTEFGKKFLVIIDQIKSLQDELT